MKTKTRIAAAIITSIAGVIVAACVGADAIVVQPDGSPDASAAADTGAGTLTGVDGSSAGDATTTAPADAGADADASAATDGSTDADASPPTSTEPAHLILVNATTDLGPNAPSGIFRFCFATASVATPQSTDFVVSPLPAMPHTATGALPFPGTPIGTGGPFLNTGASLEGLTIRPYLMNAQKLAARGFTGALTPPRCNNLLAPGLSGGDLVQNVDYWQLPDVAAGRLKNGKTYLFIATGCVSDSNGTTFAGKCGLVPGGAALYAPPGGAGAGNLSTLVAELDTTTPVPGASLGVQVVHASPQYDRARALGALPPFKPVAGNAATASSAALAATPSGVELIYTPSATSSAASGLVALSGIVTASGFFAANIDGNPASGGNQPLMRAALNNVGAAANASDAGASSVSIQAHSTGNGAETLEYITNGKSYTFVLVGDPSINDGTTRQIHFLAFPNVFAPPTTVF